MRNNKLVKIVNISDFSGQMMAGSTIILVWVSESFSEMRGIIAEGEKTKHFTSADNPLYHGVVRPSFGGKTAEERIQNFFDYTGGIELKV